MIIEAFKRCELNKVWGLIEGEWVHIKEEYLSHHKPQVGHEIQDHPAAPIAVDTTPSIPFTPLFMDTLTLPFENGD